jgi:hypothetical protein
VLAAATAAADAAENVERSTRERALALMETTRTVAPGFPLLDFAYDPADPARSTVEVDLGTFEWLVQRAVT